MADTMPRCTVRAVCFVGLATISLDYFKRLVRARRFFGRVRFIQVLSSLPGADSDTCRQFLHQKLDERTARCRQVAVRIDKPKPRFASTRARQYPLQPPRVHELHADRLRQECDAEPIGGTLSGDPRLVHRDTPINDHVLTPLPLAYIDIPRDPVRARAKNYATMVCEVTHATRSAVRLQVVGARVEAPGSVEKSPSNEPVGPARGT